MDLQHLNKIINSLMDLSALLFSVSLKVPVFNSIFILIRTNSGRNEPIERITISYNLHCSDVDIIFLNLNYIKIKFS